MVQNKCYMCDSAATSVEHVPPRCLFPEKKDLPPEVDLRKQLITVPACELHNTAKSKDDEYLLYALLMNIPNNQTGSNHFLTKILRAIKRNPSLISVFAQSQLPVLVEDTATGHIQQTVAMQVDLPRLTTGLEMIGRALYFHHFKATWSGTVDAYPTFILSITEPNARELNEPVERMAATVEELFKDAPRYGENPEVFYYQVAPGIPPTAFVMLLKFYEGSRVTLLFKNA